MAVGEGRKRATVKLIPRIDLQAMAEKIVISYILLCLLFCYYQEVCWLLDDVNCF